jgi:hypothetical protein
VSRSTVILVALIVVLGAFLVGQLLVQPNHPGGDPGGLILQSLKAPVQSALPPGARVVAPSYVEPHWTAGCGWSAVFVMLSFTSQQSRSEVVDFANTALTAHGWTRLAYPGISGPATWTQSNGGGSVKRIDLANDTGMPSGEYSLSAAAPSEGEQGTC